MSKQNSSSTYADNSYGFLAITTGNPDISVMTGDMRLFMTNNIYTFTGSNGMISIEDNDFSKSSITSTNEYRLDESDIFKGTSTYQSSNELFNTSLLLQSSISSINTQTGSVTALVNVTNLDVDCVISEITDVLDGTSKSAIIALDREEKSAHIIFDGEIKYTTDLSQTFQNVTQIKGTLSEDQVSHTRDWWVIIKYL